MFGIGTTEVLIILVVALIVIGPNKLPDVARTLGKALGEFKRMSSDVKRTIDLEAERAEEAAKTREAEKELYDKQKSASSKAPAAQVEVVDEGKGSNDRTKETAGSGVTGKEA
ncbi:Sec-independent protein translocase protein TatB [Desulfoplanes formicivorans]|uniref:Sec-independent protein translocase protein TatA n=1 Tax=Desulfoplanes formicivorans TaxID=1592317 RepID=A0A194AKD2_9BACT|nr:Sec-independent protein translocase protein TatB [Desulfoplanes formicivorans]GAU09695.1 preprotein translocase subunit TatA [Desulfoplanes formicivorans]